MVFGDIGWVGDRRAYREVGRPMSGVGIGASMLDGLIRADVSREDVRAHAQGLRRSAMHAEVRFHEGEPYLLEIAARVGGGGLDEIARLTTGYDPIRAVGPLGGQRCAGRIDCGRDKHKKRKHHKRRR